MLGMVEEARHQTGKVHQVGQSAMPGEDPAPILQFVEHGIERRATGAEFARQLQRRLDEQALRPTAQPSPIHAAQQEQAQDRGREITLHRMD